MAARRKVSLKRRLRYKLGDAAVWAAMLIARIVPNRWADSIGSFVGRLGFTFERRRRERCLSNLRMCFPEWCESKIAATAKQVFVHFGKTAMRFFYSSKLSEQEVIDSVSGLDLTEISKALEAKKGAIVITAHFGNWERAANYMCVKGLRLSVVARNANDVRTSERINKTRKRGGVEVLSRGSAAKEIMRALRDNRIVAILPDQNARELFVPFFGFPAGTVAGPAVIHLRTGAPVFIGMVWETTSGDYDGFCRRLFFEGLTGEREADTNRIMAQINRALETTIREHPSQWLWMHDRWKSARERGMLEA